MSLVDHSFGAYGHFEIGQYILILQTFILYLSYFTSQLNPGLEYSRKIEKSYS